MSELEAVLRESVDRLLGEQVTREVLEAAEEGGWPAKLWAALEENGLTRPFAAAEGDAPGAGWREAEVVLRAAGYHAAPVPLAETVLAARLLELAGLEAPEGVFTLALPQAGESLRLEGPADAPRLTGEVAGVPWARAASAIVAVAEREGEARLALVAPEAADAQPAQNVAREPRDRLRFEAGPIRATSDRPLPDGLSGVRHQAAFVRSAQMAGGIERLLDEAVAYAKERIQFGRPIARFQAIQHQLAVLASESVAATAAVEAAGRALERGEGAFETAVAKVRAGEAAGEGARIAHQVHGAIGFTYEHGLHFVTRRLFGWRAEYGAEREWAEWLGREVHAAGADRLWSDLSER